MTPASSILDPNSSFRFTERLRLETLAEGFNLTNHVNGVTLNGIFGTGIYPSNPSSTFKQITAVGDPRTFQFGVRASLYDDQMVTTLLSTVLGLNLGPMGPSPAHEPQLAARGP